MREVYVGSSSRLGSMCRKLHVSPPTPLTLLSTFPRHLFPLHLLLLVLLFVAATTTTTAFQLSSPVRRLSFQRHHPQLARRSLSPAHSPRGVSSPLSAPPVYSPPSSSSSSTTTTTTTISSSSSSSSFQPLRANYNTSNAAVNDRRGGKATKTMTIGAEGEAVSEEELLMRGPPPPSIGPLTRVRMGRTV